MKVKGQYRWGILRSQHILDVYPTAYFCSNISAKSRRNWLAYTKDMESKKCDFGTQQIEDRHEICHVDRVRDDGGSGALNSLCYS